LLKRFRLEDPPEVLVGMNTSDDAGVYRLTGEIALVQTVDFITPLTDDPFLFGQIAAANALSDVYAMGAKPLTALNLCCFPGSGIPSEWLEAILLGGLEKIQEAGAVLLGGHSVQDSELKYGLSVTGIVHPDQVIANAGARPGALLVLTKPIGSGVLFGPVKSGQLPGELWERILGDMAQLNKISSELMVEFGAQACTDITGFGLAGHALEMAKASGVELTIRTGLIPHYREALDIIRAGGKTRMTDLNRQVVAGFWHCGENVPPEEEQLLFDPQTSGGLLISISAEKAQPFVEALHARGIQHAAIIGEVQAAASPKISIKPDNNLKTRI